MTLRFSIIMVCLLFTIHPRVLLGQNAAVPKQRAEPQAKKDAPAARELVLTQTTLVPLEAAGTIATPLHCDSDANLYFQSDHFGVTGIRKLNPKGERLAVFQAAASPDITKLDLVSSFALGQDGSVYELAFPHEITRFVVVFKSDGSYRSTIKLQPGFAWIPHTLAAFPSGNLLVAGEEYGRDKDGIRELFPFTGIFSSDGTLLKEVKFEDDDLLHDMAANGDTRVTDPKNPSANHAISFSLMQAAADGNIYLMRWTSPAILYGISPGGEVTRRFTVDPGDSDYRPGAMHISDNRVAITFFHPQTMEGKIKIVDLEGHDITTYNTPKVNGKPDPRFNMLSFSCFTSNPQRFLFVSTSEDYKLEMITAEPR
jgi:hypothetical protein